MEPVKSVRGPPPEEEVTKTTCDELTTPLIFWPPVPLGWREEKIGSEVEPGKKGGMEGRCFKILLLVLITLI